MVNVPSWFPPFMALCCVVMTVAVALFARAAIHWRRQAWEEQAENLRLRRLWDSTIGKSPPEATVASLLETIESAKPAGITTETVLETLLASVRANGSRPAASGR